MVHSGRPSVPDAPVGESLLSRAVLSAASRRCESLQSFSPCKRPDSAPPKEEQSTPEKRRENQIPPAVLWIDLRRRKDSGRDSIGTPVQREERRPQRLRSSWLMNPSRPGNESHR